MPISFPWANALVYRIVGEASPAPAARPAAPAGQSPPSNTNAVGAVTGLDAAAAVAIRHVDDWRTITARTPASSSAPFVFTIDRGTAGQPQYRGTLTTARDGQFGAVFLVWTGTALAVRRLWASLRHRRRDDVREERPAA